MKTIFAILLLSACVLESLAQQTSGITHIPDTSFNNPSAYRSAVKKWPEIRLAPDTLPRGVAVDTNITYYNKLKLDVFYPVGRRHPLPGVLIIHGGGWRSGNRQQHRAMAAQLAAKGYICYLPSYTLSTDALFPVAVQDLKTAIRWIKVYYKKWNTDTTRIAVAGFSAGGQLAAFIGSTNGIAALEHPAKLKASSDVQAIISIDGILAFIHPESAEGNDSKSTSAATYWFGYTKEEQPDRWHAASALSYANAHTPPTLFINSSNPRFHAGRGDFINILQSANIYTEVHELDNTPHTFCLFEPWFSPTIQYMSAFLDKVFAR